ncbi:cellulase family glycosylhydrolase [Bacillus licheniformis]|nr:cellulase family glycosylhydrolase [Bacillus licheniformis]
MKEAVEAAKELGIYVIIDWHILSDGNPNQTKRKQRIFNEMSRLYGKTPNVILKLPTSRTAMSTGIATLNLTPKKSCP